MIQIEEYRFIMLLNGFFFKFKKNNHTRNSWSVNKTTSLFFIKLSKVTTTAEIEQTEDDGVL